MRLLISALLLAAISAAPAAAKPLRAPVVSSGCQGEGCYDKGHWIVTKPLRLYARPFAPKPIATLGKGTRLTALGGQIWTTRIGTAVLTKDVINQEPSGNTTLRLSKGARVRLLYSEGEGYLAGRTLDGRAVELFDDEFRTLVDFRAEDWVRVRLADDRLGWIRHEYEKLDCSSY
jgi:hypothetical protein